MSRVVVLGAGIAGHTAASFARRWLPPSESVTVVTPEPDYNWVPSNIWVGVGLMRPSQVTFPLAPVYERHGIELVRGFAREVHPEGDADDPDPYVAVEPVRTAAGGTRSPAGRGPGTLEAARGPGTLEKVRYDFLVNATGPKLRFDLTEGLGPDAHSHSVCTVEHAVQASAAFDEAVGRMRRGERQRFLVGTGHGACTCEGAAFEYIVNLEFELRARKVRDQAEIVWITNEYELGDFGMAGMHMRRGGYVVPSSIFTASLFAERGISWITRAHVQQVEAGRVCYETLDGVEHEQGFDFAMLLPPFSGVGLEAFDRQGADITDRLFLANHFMRVDADYRAKAYEDWTAEDWPRTYQSPEYPNIFAAGIAFAPPHAISRPRTSPRGTLIAPAAPRTGMPSAEIGRSVARSIVDMIMGAEGPTATASMAEMGAACVASAGANPFTGTAASMTVFPIVPDFARYPEYGRDMDKTFGEIGLAGHWIKILLHHLFLYKARLHPGWSLIPE